MSSADRWSALERGLIGGTSVSRETGVRCGICHVGLKDRKTGICGNEFCGQEIDAANAE
ncbi:MAG: hypothetical protein V4449_00500 [Patescibacteria group bacterium]